MDFIKAELVDELLKGYERPEDIIGENGLLRRLTKTLLERALTEAGAVAQLRVGACLQEYVQIVAPCADRSTAPSGPSVTASIPDALDSNVGGVRWS